MPRLYIPNDPNDETKGCIPIDLCNRCWARYVIGKTADQAWDLAQALGTQQLGQDRDFNHVLAAFADTPDEGEEVVGYVVKEGSRPHCKIARCWITLTEADEHYPAEK